MGQLRATPLASAGRAPGRVYLVKAIGQDAYKIGASKNLTGRMRYFHTNLPFKVYLVHVIETPDPKRLERELHKLFAGKRINGEWFRLSEADIDTFKRYPGATPEFSTRPISRRPAKRRVPPGDPGL